MTAAGAPRTILIIDDEIGVRDAVELALRKAGYRTIACADGDAALARLDAEPALPSLILFAWAMPVAKSLELCAALAADRRRAALPVVVLCGASHASSVPAQVACVLGKPARLRTLLHVIARLSGAGDVAVTPIIRRGRGRPTQLIRKWVRGGGESEADTERHVTPVPAARAS